jgi:hypothetical protein
MNIKLSLKEFKAIILVFAKLESLKSAYKVDLEINDFGIIERILVSSRSGEQIRLPLPITKQKSTN